MKTLSIAILLLLTIKSFSQEEVIPKIDYDNQPYYLKSDGSLSKLERAEGAMAAKLKGMGIGGSEMFIKVFNGTSNVRFSKNNLPVFYVKLSTSEDPETIIKLSKASQVEKKHRSFLLRKQGLTGNVKSNQENNIRLNITKLTDEIFKIEIAQNIEIGEYSFMPFKSIDLQGSVAYSATASQILFCFGIDE